MIIHLDGHFVCQCPFLFAPRAHVDDAHYLVAVPWLKQWSFYWLRFEKGKANRVPPGPIDNRGLFEDVDKEILRYLLLEIYNFFIGRYR